MYADWIKSLGKERCYLVEAEYELGSAVHTLRLSTHPYRSGPTDTPAWTAYPDYILNPGTFDRQMSEMFTGQSILGSTEIELFLHPDDIQPLLTEADFGGRSVTIRCGDKFWPLAEFGLIATGAIADSLVQSSETTAVLKLRDRAAIFDKPILTETYASGPSEGRLIPLALGNCFNVKPELIDANNHTYQVSTGPVSAIGPVRENGHAIPHTVDLATGKFTLINAAAGTITCDVAGIISGSYLQYPAQIINWLLARLGLPASANQGWPNVPVGLYLNSDSSDLSYRAAFDALAKSLAAAWYFDRYSVLKLHRFNGLPADPESSLQIEEPPGSGNYVTVPVTNADLSGEIERGSLRPRRRIPPLKTLKLGYSRNWSPLSTIAEVVRDTDPVLATRLENQYSYVDDNNNTASLDAADVTTDTLLTTKAAATAECSRRLGLAVNARNIYELTAAAGPFAMELGQVISIDYPGTFAGGKYCCVTRLSDELSRDACQLEVLR
ncbi:hypothetical protein [Bowmanella denitrificans]|uniref:hypothetical protein n=1 Tax=Bowmanella denitrificans TaxID=366582 RepID=UPI000C9B3963|nr:hypothetical protein [Bowmanella denitrificans]